MIYFGHFKNIKILANMAYPPTVPFGSIPNFLKPILNQISYKCPLFGRGYPFIGVLLPLLAEKRRGISYLGLHLIFWMQKHQLLMTNKSEKVPNWEGGFIIEAQHSHYSQQGSGRVGG